MSERRVDPFTGRGVLIAPERYGLGASRPAGLPAPRGRCPFCPGHEADTEPTIAQWPAEGDWEVRVLSNKFPVVARGEGEHEVGVDARAHDADLPDLSAAHLSAMLRLYRDRVAALEAREDMASVVVFRNRGRRAGSSQPHPHTQIVGLPWIPAEVAQRWERSKASAELHRAELARELASERVLIEAVESIAFCPYAPSRPWEVRLAPRDPAGGFATARDEELASIAAQLVEVTRRLRERTPATDYNVIVRSPPARATGPAAAWHVEILPRTGGDAGFELASGEMVVVVSPEDAAALLR